MKLLHFLTRITLLTSSLFAKIHNGSFYSMNREWNRKKDKLKKIKFILGIGFTLLIVGCNYKYLRTKPTTFIDIDKNGSKYQCIDANEHYTSTETANCDGYISVNKNKLMEENISQVVNELFYISDTNCKRFTDRFQYNQVGERAMNKFLGVNLFGVGIGINFGDITTLTSEQFSEFSNNLKENLQKRSSLKTNILNKTKNKNYTKEEMFVDFIEYDKSCSLFPVFDINSSKQ